MDESSSLNRVCTRATLHTLLAGFVRSVRDPRPFCRVLISSRRQTRPRRPLRFQEERETNEGNENVRDRRAAAGYLRSDDVLREGAIVLPRVGWKEKVIFSNSHRDDLFAKWPDVRGTTEHG